MHITLELPEPLAQQFIAHVPSAKQQDYLLALLRQDLNTALATPIVATPSVSPSSQDDRQDIEASLPFTPLPSRGGTVTNELVNQLREQGSMPTVHPVLSQVQLYYDPTEPLTAEEWLGEP